MKPTVRLGQRVYQVNHRGEIISSLISEITLIETVTPPPMTDSEFVELFGKMLDGDTNKDGQHFKYGFLRHHHGQTHLNFDEACDAALAILLKLVTATNITIAELNQIDARLDQLRTNKEASRAQIDSVGAFDWSSSLSGLVEGQKRFTIADFPKHYIEPGTPVWVADTDDWQLMQGMVTGVNFSRHHKRHLQYSCGRRNRVDPERVYLTKKGALRYLEKAFAKKFPGTLDRARVPVVRQLTEAERQRDEYDRISGIAERMTRMMPQE